MTRCFLNLLVSDVRIADPDGQEFSSLDEARREALAAIRDILADELRNAGTCTVQNRFVEISDKNGTVCALVSFREAIKTDLLERPEIAQRA
jgi:hypothetical protein